MRPETEAIRASEAAVLHQQIECWRKFGAADLCDCCCSAALLQLRQTNTSAQLWVDPASRILLLASFRREGQQRPKKDRRPRRGEAKNTHEPTFPSSQRQRFVSASIGAHPTAADERGASILSGFPRPVPWRIPNLNHPNGRRPQVDRCSSVPRLVRSPVASSRTATILRAPSRCPLRAP